MPAVILQRVRIARSSVINQCSRQNNLHILHLHCTDRPLILTHIQISNRKYSYVCIFVLFKETVRQDASP